MVRSFGGGGIENVEIHKANALAEISGNEVYLIVTDNPLNYHMAGEISPKVKFIDLGVNYYESTSIFEMLCKRPAKQRLHCKRLKQALNMIKPDIVVSADMAEKNIIPKIAGKWKTVREFHLVRTKHLPKSKSLWERFANYVSYLDQSRMVWKYDSIVTLTNEDKQSNWNGDERVEVIPNPVGFSCTESAALESKRVVAMGRLVEQKNFKSLIRAFKIVAEKHPDWTLDIYGEGPQRAMLNKKIADMGLEQNVFLRGYTDDARGVMLGASCFALSSLYEGFGVVLVEAMMCGLPIVSYACPCGPKDIISDGSDGFLVPVGDEQAMADRICQLIDDKELRQRMGKAAKEKANKYKIENIIPQWMNLFNRLIDKK